MTTIGIFPFGQPIHQVRQADRCRKTAFVLGVYASAVHARWLGPDGRTRINAVGVASEPEIFWNGDRGQASFIIGSIVLPSDTGRLEPAGSQSNGPSGRSLDGHFLHPLGLSRQDAWLCDLVPHSCMNEKQAAALEREYEPRRLPAGLPPYDWRPLPTILADDRRRSEIEAEIVESEASILITLGDQPLRWFTSHYGSMPRLADFGRRPSQYGRLHPFRIGGRDVSLLPLVHPRQAGKLGSHSSEWSALHAGWTSTTANTVLT